MVTKYTLFYRGSGSLSVAMETIAQNFPERFEGAENASKIDRLKRACRQHDRLSFNAPVTCWSHFCGQNSLIPPTTE